jgi:ribonucleoside-diphosphate reductase beta chain
MVDDHPLPWLAPLINGVEHANFFETRATEYSKAATRGNWQDVWASFDQRRNAKASAANETGEGDGPGLFGDEGGAAGEAQAAE